MKKIVIATTNKGKLLEFSEYLNELDIEIFSLADFPGIPETEENGKTFMENALIKADAACSFTMLPSLADDSGLMVDALNGAPGVLSSRFGPDTKTRNRLLLDLMKDVEESERTARFVCSLAFVKPDGFKWTTEGKCAGTILKEPRGSGGFGYDPLFYYPPLGATFAEIPLEKKNLISHRGLALSEFRHALIYEGIL